MHATQGQTPRLLGCFNRNAGCPTRTSSVRHQQHLRVLGPVSHVLPPNFVHRLPSDEVATATFQPMLPDEGPPSLGALRAANLYLLFATRTSDNGVVIARHATREEPLTASMRSIACGRKSATRKCGATLPLLGAWSDSSRVGKECRVFLDRLDSRRGPVFQLASVDQGSSSKFTSPVSSLRPRRELQVPVRDVRTSTSTKKEKPELVNTQTQQKTMKRNIKVKLQQVPTQVNPGAHVRAAVNTRSRIPEFPDSRIFQNFTH